MKIRGSLVRLLTLGPVGDIMKREDLAVNFDDRVGQRSLSLFFSILSISSVVNYKSNVVYQSKHVSQSIEKTRAIVFTGILCNVIISNSYPELLQS